MCFFSFQLLHVCEWISKRTVSARPTHSFVMFVLSLSLSHIHTHSSYLVSSFEHHGWLCWLIRIGETLLGAAQRVYRALVCIVVWWIFFFCYHTCKTFANFQANARLFFMAIRIHVNSRKIVFRIEKGEHFMHETLFMWSGKNNNETSEKISMKKKTKKEWKKERTYVMVI